MKQSVTVNGVTLTRQQVEMALNDLNTPEKPFLMEPMPGDFQLFKKGSASIRKYEKYAGKALFLFCPDRDYEWAFAEDDSAGGQPFKGACKTLILRLREGAQK
jgi:hypothetical protein